MLIRKLYAKNWMCHKKLDLTFKPGLNGCLGPNGSGKSALLDALRFAVTGESIGAGTKNDNITIGEKSAIVSLDFDHGDTSYSIVRKLEPTRQELKYNDKSFTKTAEIESQLIGILGARFDALLNNVFVGQHAIDSILYKTNTERLKEFQDTFGLTRLAEAYRALSSEIAECQVTPGLKEQRDTVVEATKETRGEIATYKGELQDIEAKLKELLPLVESLAKHDQMSALLDAQREAQDTLGKLVTERDDLKLSEENQRLAVSNLTELVAELSEKATEASMLLSKHQQGMAKKSVLESELEKARNVQPPPHDLETRIELANKLSVHLGKLKAILDGSAARPKLPDEEVVQGLLSETTAKLADLERKDPVLEVLESDLRREEHTLKTFATGVCPTCERPLENFDLAQQEKKVADLKDVVRLRKSERQAAEASLTKEAGELKAKLKNMEDTALGVLRKAAANTKADLDAAVKDAQLGTSAKVDYETAQKRVSELLKTVSQVQTFGPDVLADAQRTVDRHSTLIADLAKAKSAWDITKNKLVLVEREIVRVSSSIKTADTAGILSADDYKKAKLAQLELGQLSMLKRELETKYGIADAKLQQQLHSIESMNQRLEEESKSYRWSSLCLKARDVVHVSGLPTLMMKEYASRINARIDYYMRIWESPFRFYLDDNLTFKAVFEDGTSMAAARLSGGQKIVASTSFRLAMSDTFARGVGLLILDEPTNHLDKDNVVHLQQLLVKLKQLAGTSRRQMIIVTHEEQLTGFFDNTIRLLPSKIT